jgi:ABC-2 type transport system permease protein
MSAQTTPYADVPAPSRPSVLAPLRALTILLLRNQATRGRLVALAALGAVGVLVGAVVTDNSTLDATVAGTRFVNLYGLSLLTPVVALVFGAGALGDLVDDRSLVYLWLPPVPRWVIALAAWAATLIVCTPFTLGASVLMAAATGGGADLVIGTLWAGLLGLVAYSGLFTALGLRFRRALVWGFAYLLIWENFVAQAGDGAARLSILSYLRSVLSAYTGAGLELADRDLIASFIVPIVVGLLGVAYTARRLHTTDVD